MQQVLPGTNKAHHLYVANMSTRITESDLRAMMEPFGNVKTVSLVTANAANLSRSFAFVEMSDENAVARAVAELNGKSVDGCCLRIKNGR
jgi:RNA recognition motif-containing protein